ncbi:DUF6174 domain-containing protein [Streptomyces sp. NPDC093516]|uniref:DUF6174 domain-containing protein n=1 Tax=unclassified Streptomyces TaxID=2593676 RepID=UPI0034284EFC
MTAGSRTVRAARTVVRTALAAGLLCAVAACTSGAPHARSARGPQDPGRTAWQEPAAYSYTLRSSGGERTLLGAYRVSVRDGAVVEAVGLDDTARRVVAGTPGAVPTLGQLLAELDRARRAGAATAEAEHADDGHPVRIVLDEDANAVDDEARYDISGYAPAGRG